MKTASRIGYVALLVAWGLAALAGAGPAATAPPPLPAVIIGDSGDVSGTGETALHLFRYENVFNLASSAVFDRRFSESHGTTTALLRVYYTVPGPSTNSLRASNKTTLVQPLTPAEFASLLAGVAPPVAKRLNTLADFWLSLIHDAGTTHPVNAKSATPSRNGATLAALGAQGSPNPTVVSLYATDAAAPTGDSVSSRSFVVYSIVDAVDEYSPATYRVVYDSGDRLGLPEHDGWVNPVRLPTGNPQSSQIIDPGNIQEANILSTPKGIGFAGVATFGRGKNMACSSWYNAAPATMVGAAGIGSGAIIRATLKITGNAPTRSLTPGYRVLFSSLGFGHVGGFVVASGATNMTPSAINLPSSGTAVNPRLYWAVPKSLNQYGDGEAAMLAGQAGFDLRDYFLYFDILQTQAGQTGSIILEHVLIERIQRPLTVTPAVKWGGSGGLAFNTPGKGWSLAPTDGGTGWGVGSGAVTASSVGVSMKSTATSVFQQVSPRVAPTVGYPAWESNRLVRVSYSLASSDVNICPSFRMIVLAWTAAFNTGNVCWGEAINPSEFYGWYPPTQASLAASPKTGGSLLETYIYGQNAPTAGSEACFLAPVFDIDQARVGFPINGWAAPRAAVSITGVSMEVLD